MEIKRKMNIKQQEEMSKIGCRESPFQRKSGKWCHLASLLEKGKNKGILRLLEDFLLCVYIHLKSYYAVLLWLGSS